MFTYRIAISILTVWAYYLVTDKDTFKHGLWLSLFTEFNWALMFILSDMYELIPISFFMVLVSMKRLKNG